MWDDLKSIKAGFLSKLTYRGHTMRFLRSKKGKEFIAFHHGENNNEDYDEGYGICKSVPPAGPHLLDPLSSNPSTWNYEVENSPFLNHPINLTCEQQLKDHFRDIKLEFERVKNTLSDHPENMVSHNSGRWSSIDLIGVDNKGTATLDKCPILKQVLSSMNLATGYGFVFFSRLDPNTVIAPHHGSTNIRSRIHLGLDIPHREVYLQVAGKTVKWTTGGTLCFDDSYAHCSWNKSSQPRDVLIVDIFNPHLTQDEVKFLKDKRLYNFGKYKTS